MALVRATPRVSREHRADGTTVYRARAATASIPEEAGALPADGRGASVSLVVTVGPDDVVRRTELRGLGTATTITYTGMGGPQGITAP